MSNESNHRPLQIVVLDCVHDLWNDLAVRELFGDVLALRFQGYGFEYPDGVIPVDSADFYGTHIVTCEVLPDGRLVPVSSYKFVSVQRSREFRKEFTALQIANDAKSEPHARIIISIMKKADSSKHDLGYCCSWTIHPRIRKNELLTKTIRNIVYSTHLNWQDAYNVPEMLIAGVLRFKTDAYQESIGYKRLAENGEILGSFGHADLAGEQVVMLHLTDFPEYSLNMKRKYQSYWDSRIVYAAEKRLPRPQVEEAQIEVQERKAA